ncbi:acylneuraminate cytidylyltransferase family protein [Daejeonella lutea]|uniref:N-acylneuraminate cytidylyltransferase n=1 Tax=Daejeonella lutea TaxID=572036 RepID=A0A1T5FC66_9SPHI|nr:acylneuraminate cytidylyltransferase family protein [Daejeonella lutea]SKB93676.1 N-acylneuraminate cytidylyltransferase [Daejeonella lutea]
MKFISIIPARGGSKGIPGKNIYPLFGKPLLGWTIEASLGSNFVHRTIVSTDDPEIASVALEFGAEVPILRPEELAEDDTPTMAVLQHVVQYLAVHEEWIPDAVITLQPTSPLRTSEDIDQAVQLFLSDPNADSLVSCIEVPHIFHPTSVMELNAEGYLKNFINGQQPTRRQDKAPVLARNGAAIYITRLNCIDKFVWGGKALAYLMNAERSVDIDNIEDLKTAEKYLARRK